MLFETLTYLQVDAIYAICGSDTLAVFGLNLDQRERATVTTDNAELSAGSLDNSATLGGGIDCLLNVISLDRLGPMKEEFVPPKCCPCRAMSGASPNTIVHRFHVAIPVYPAHFS